MAIRFLVILLLLTGTLSIVPSASACTFSPLAFGHREDLVGDDYVFVGVSCDPLMSSSGAEISETSYYVVAEGISEVRTCEIDGTCSRACTFYKGCVAELQSPYANATSAAQHGQWSSNYTASAPGLDVSACVAQIPSRTDPSPAQRVIAPPCAALLTIESDAAGYERAIEYPWALVAECTHGTLPECERALMLAGSEGTPEDVRALLLSVRAAERGYALLG